MTKFSTLHKSWMKDPAYRKEYEAFWSNELSEFILPYGAVLTAKAPERELVAFLQSTYEAAVELANWPRGELECALGERGKVRLA